MTALSPRALARLELLRAEGRSPVRVTPDLDWFLEPEPDGGALLPITTLRVTDKEYRHPPTPEAPKGRSLLLYVGTVDPETGQRFGAYTKRGGGRTTLYRFGRNQYTEDRPRHA